MTEAQDEYVADNLEQILSNLDDETLIAEMKRRGFTTSKKRFDEPFCVKGSLKDKIITNVWVSPFSNKFKVNIEIGDVIRVSDLIEEIHKTIKEIEHIGSYIHGEQRELALEILGEAKEIVSKLKIEVK